MPNYYAPKSDVQKILNNIERMMKQIDKLWIKNGFSKEEIAFWAPRRSMLHHMLDDTVKRYKITTYVR